MSIIEAMRETMKLLNLIEVRGENSIAAISKAMSNVKGVVNALEAVKEEPNEGHDRQGEDDPD